ncbi:MAG: hypothetical protein ACR2PW_07760 [Gammaproteobacteria bacterium]
MFTNDKILRAYQVYVYGACIVAVIALVVCIPLAVYSTISIFFPQLVIDPALYLDYLANSVSQTQYENEIKILQFRAQQRLVPQSMVLLTASVMWVVHFKLARRINSDD